MSSEQEAPANFPLVDAGEAPEGKNGARAAAPNPTPKAPAQKQAPLPMDPPQRRSVRRENGSEPSRKVKDVPAAADAAEGAQLKEAEPSESAPDAAREKGAAAKPPTEGAKGVPVSKLGALPEEHAGNDNPKGEKRVRDRSRSRKPGLSWPESLERRYAREEAAAVERETAAAERAKEARAQEGKRKLRAALRDARKRWQPAREGNDDDEISIEELAIDLAAADSESDAEHVADAGDGGGGNKSSSSPPIWR